MTSKYEKFDAAVLNAIKARPRVFAEIAGMDEIMDLAQPHVTESSPDWRILDRRLQVLRNKGFIHYTESRWHVR